MGAYFSLHEAREWEHAVNAMTAPSIWSHASFSPLTRAQKVLLERPGRVEYVFPKGMQQGQDYFVISEASELSLLVCFEPKVGRLYSGVLLQAPEEDLHIYRQAVDQVVLRAPGRQEHSSTLGSSSGAATQLPGGSILSGGDSREEGRGGGEDPYAHLEESEARRLRTLFGTSEQLGSGDAPYSPLQASATRRLRREAEGRASPEPSGELSLDKMWQDGPMQESTWQYMLLYNVKEGVLVYVANDRESCEDVIREIAGAFGVKPPPPTSDISPPKASRRPPAATAKDQPDIEVTSVVVPVGVVCTMDNKSTQEKKPDEKKKPQGNQAEIRPSWTYCDPCVHVDDPTRQRNADATVMRSTTKKVADTIKLDLTRRFAVSCDIAEQHDYTNCVIFCLRIMLEFQLSLRGYDLQRACEERADLGKNAGEAVAEAWEQMWVRSGGMKGVGEAIGPEGTRWYREHYSQRP